MKVPDHRLVCVDVDYREDGARAALVAFDDWRDESPIAERVEVIHDVAEYEPGQFYKRELPCLMRVLDGLSPRLIVVDGYVWLGERPGLGAKLFEALEGRVPVIGVGKTEFKSATSAAAVHRGGSTRPLFVTARGIELGEAVEAIRSMHGDHRIPTLLRRVDRLCRDAR